jgi:hypothetical protein
MNNLAVCVQRLTNYLAGMVRVDDGGALMDGTGPIDPLSTNFALVKLWRR